LLVFFLILFGVRYLNHRPQTALELEKQCNPDDIQLVPTGLANTDVGPCYVASCYIQGANAIPAKSGSESLATKTRAGAECKSDLQDSSGVHYESLQDTNREVVQEAIYEKLKKPLNV
jgi:hypothetical protein